MIKRKILIISDSCRDCVSALHGLINIDENVIEKTIEACTDVNFSLFYIILLDCGYNIPVGLNLLEKIKKTAPQSIVIFIGNTSSEDHVLKIFRLGARDFIKKPIDIQELRNSIIKLYNAKISTREKRAHVPLLLEDQGLLRSRVCMKNNSCNMDKVLNYIDENLHYDIHLEDLEEVANLSKFHFIRRFRNHTGFTPKEFIIYSRIEKAKKILINQEQVKHIAVIG